MQHVLCLVVFLAVVVTTASTAQATIACSIVSHAQNKTSVSLFLEPDGTSVAIREVPVGDLVVYPQEELAPAQAEGWVWVRHDMTQETIWQTGMFGWVRSENIANCG